MGEGFEREAFEPDPARARRLHGGLAILYALASLLLLAVCCAGVVWFDHTVAALLRGLR